MNKITKYSSLLLLSVAFSSQSFAINLEEEATKNQKNINCAKNGNEFSPGCEKFKPSAIKIDKDRFFSHVIYSDAKNANIGDVEVSVRNMIISMLVNHYNSPESENLSDLRRVSDDLEYFIIETKAYAYKDSDKMLSFLKTKYRGLSGYGLQDEKVMDAGKKLANEFANNYMSFLEEDEKRKKNAAEAKKEQEKIEADNRERERLVKEKEDARIREEKIKKEKDEIAQMAAQQEAERKKLEGQYRETINKYIKSGSIAKDVQESVLFDNVVIIERTTGGINQYFLGTGPLISFFDVLAGEKKITVNGNQTIITQTVQDELTKNKYVIIYAVQDRVVSRLIVNNREFQESEHKLVFNELGKFIYKQK